MNNFDPTEIEELVGNAVYEAGVSANVFPNRPKSSTKDLADFVVCRVSGQIRDLAAIGQCYLSVSLFAKDLSNMKNTQKLSVMQEKALRSIPRSIGNVIIDNRPNVIGDAPDGNGYHARIIEYSLIIKTQ